MQNVSSPAPETDPRAVIAGLPPLLRMKSAGEGVVYWPSYEMVRWIGGHTGGAFGGDDGSNHHVTDALVSDIVELFVERFGQNEGL